MKTNEGGADRRMGECYCNRFFQGTSRNIKPRKVMIGMLNAEGLKDIAILADRLIRCGAAVHRCLHSIIQRDQTGVGVKRQPEQKHDQ